MIIKVNLEYDSLVAFIIGGVVIGCGIYALVRSLKKEAKGEFVGCSGGMSTSCSSRKDD